MKKLDFEKKFKITIYPTTCTVQYIAPYNLTIPKRKLPENNEKYMVGWSIMDCSWKVCRHCHLGVMKGNILKNSPTVAIDIAWHQRIAQSSAQDGTHMKMCEDISNSKNMFSIWKSY